MLSPSFFTLVFEEYSKYFGEKLTRREDGERGV